ncbi:MAG TPA: amidohydrolase [Negativicutes bacterium]|nr:amidohydrolase [Negativicutes bacterium]
MDMLREAERIKQDLVGLRRDLHMHPELSNEEFRTVGIVEDTLRSLGIATKRIAGTGLIGLLKGNGPGKTVALRADMDALPLADGKSVEYASQVPGKMHACGHDVHTAGLLGAAMLLSKHREQFAGNVKFLFQPAEETTGGALPMIEDGALANPKVDAVFGLHVMPQLKAGAIGISYGKAYAASDMFDVSIAGRASHGAAPHGGIDAIVVGAQVVTALQTFASRNVDPVDSAVVTVGKFTGGYQRNIIADKVELSGIIRTLDPQTREFATIRVKEIIEGVARSLQAEAVVSFTPSYPSVINDKAMVDFVRGVAEGVVGKENVVLIEKPTMGVEDFAYYLQKAPGAFFQLGIGNEEKGIVHPLHSNLFDVDEAALPIAAAVHTGIVLGFLAR